MASSTLPRADDKLLAWSLNFRDRIVADPVSVGLTAALATAYSALHNSYATTLATATAPETRTKPNITAKDTAKAALVKDIRLLTRLVDGTASVTKAQKEALGINVRKPPTPAPVPSTSPVVEVKSVVQDIITLDVHDSASSKRSKPPQTRGACIYYFVGETLPADLSAWNYQGIAQRRKVILQITNASPFARVWITAQWQNTRGEVGLASTPISTNLGTWIVQAEAQEATPTLKAAA